MSAQKFMGKSRMSNSLAKVSEELGEDEEADENRASKKKSKEIN